MPVQLIGGEIIGSGWSNVVSHAPGSAQVVRIKFEWSKFCDDVNSELMLIKSLLPDTTRFVFDAYTKLPYKEFKQQYPVAYNDLQESGYQFDRNSNPRFPYEEVVHFTVIPLLMPIESLTLEQANFLRESLRIMHDAGVVHNDLHMSPRNYMMQNGLPVLIDFDLASLTSSLTSEAAEKAKAKDLKDNEENIFALSKKYLLVQQSVSVPVIIVGQSGSQLIVRDESGNDTQVKSESLK
jgi:hypothetical protein